MAARISIVLLTIFFTVLVSVGQETSYGPGYQTVLVNNPAFAGSEGDATLRLAYLNFYPGNNYNLQSVYLSFDSYVPAMHGGAGFFLTDDYLGGIINDLRGGFSYAYHLQVNRNTFINAGLTASFYHRGINNAKIILPDQIDPLSGQISTSAETISARGRTVFDVGAGIMIISERLIAALALNHLATPDLAGSGLQQERLERKIILNVAGTFDLGTKYQFFAKPLLLAEYQGMDLRAGLGATLENNYLSVSAVFLSDNAKDIDLQAGCSVKRGKLLFFYNYRFNIASNNRMLPLSLMHQTGLAFSLNYVDKRKVVKTINFPKL